MTKKIIDHIPILTVLVLVIGFVKLSLFYYNFSLPIKYFVGFSEVAATVSEDLLYLVLIYAALKTIELFYNDALPDFTFLSSSLTKDIVFSIAILIVNIWFLVLVFLSNEYYLKIANISSSLFISFIILMKTKAVKEFSAKNKDFAFILYFFVVALVNVVIMTSREIRTVSNGKFRGTRIVTNDTIYVSNDSSYYVGQTEKYVFLFNKPGHCTVIPISTIKEFDIYSNEK